MLHQYQAFGTLPGLRFKSDALRSDMRTFFKRECKEPSTRPFTPLLTGSSPVAFAKQAPIIYRLGYLVLN